MSTTWLNILMLVSAGRALANVLLLSTANELGKSHGEAGRVSSTTAALGDYIFLLHFNDREKREEKRAVCVVFV
ncbi:hypothetical protein F5Y02DRAFT_323830 [Annulohypoxylon stygium]|nr:hypothetical protein F5Y02DRAFT_323830 [Annulohypoxylon stygium]